MALRSLVAVATVAVAAAAPGPAATPAPPREHWVGPSFRNLPAARHTENPGVPTFIYGKCLPAPDAGCLPPLQIQNWSLARRHPARYPRAIRCVRNVLKGVPAAVFQTTGGLEVYAGRTVVFIVARSNGDVVAAARGLRRYPREQAARLLAAPPASVPRALRRCRRGNLEQALEASG